MSVLIIIIVSKHHVSSWVSFCSAACDSSCLTYSGAHDTSCTSCSEDLEIDTHGRCAIPTTCPSPHYSQQDGECHLCHKYCHECSGPHQDQCLSCNQNHYLLSEFMPLRPDALLFRYSLQCKENQRNGESCNRKAAVALNYNALRKRKKRKT